MNAQISALSANSTVSDVPESAKSFWILNPLLDYLFCCGGLVWLLFIVQHLLISHGYFLLSDTVAMLIVAGSHIFGEAHISATLFRVYGKKEIRERFKICSIWVPLGAPFLCIEALFNPIITAYMLKLYLLWVFQHFTGQTYGLVLLYCYKQNYSMNSFDKTVLSILLNSAAAVAISRQLSFSERTTNSLMGINIPAWNFLPIQIHLLCTLTLQLSSALFCVQICRKRFFEREHFPLPALLMLITIVTALTVNRETSGELLLYIPAFLHASQYLAITMSQHLKEHRSTCEMSEMESEGKEQEKGRKKEQEKGQAIAAGLRYYSSLLLTAVLMFVLLPSILSYCGFAKDLAFATIFCLLNLHHFLTDATIWKFRDKRLRRQLI